MGCDYIFSCEDCKKNYYLGYGSYSSWIYSTTLEEFEKVANKIEDSRGFDPRGRQKNKNLLWCIMEHEGHSVHLWSHDWCYERGDDIMIQGGYRDDVMIPGGAKFEIVNLDIDNTK